MNISKIVALLFCLIACLSFPTNGAEIVQLKLIHDTDIFASFKSVSVLNKDQYEKTADFTKRVCAETYKVLGIKDKTPIIFGTEYGEYATKAIYDADKQLFNIHIATVDHYNPDASYQDRWTWVPDVSEKYSFNKYDAIQIAHNYVESPGTYTGKNAFGVAREIKVGISSYAALNLPVHVYNTNIILSAKPDEAKKLNGDLRIAIATQILPPCFVAGHGHTAPTLTYLYDMTNEEMGFVGSTNAEWILYRASTNEVLKRGKFKKGGI